MLKSELREQIMQAHTSRYATKAFDPTKKIAEEDWLTIIESARLSPSSFGYEPWKFLLVNNEEIKEGLKEFAGGAINSINGASHFVIALARKNVTIKSDYVRHIVEDVLGAEFAVDSPRSLYFDNFQKHSQQLTDDRALYDWASKQTYIAMANMMTTAALLGIDSCPIEGFNKAKVEAYLSEKGLVDLDKFGVSYMLGLGYRNEPITPKKRQSLDEILEVID
ncbi:nitroreductase [Trichococcus patagoniensis]|uniref:Nitroreductase n=1 Tax=Trichococcus patagoniensis TaxID=382641 RepID=A0A2T5IIZ5_9LACT|nr:NAD(P)H-dependent oxidoreductase [Trichococcus patagoniensis]PTQ83805.1 nitroreductase [Trichococcus patagoniensis]